MADSTALDSFIAAQNFCTGSQTDYSTCIANNLLFTPFLDDTYEASSYAGLSVSKKDLPYLYGDVYVDLQPLAIANIFARVLMINSYGGVSFRCSEVFNRPRLPLPRLQDLGIPAQGILNIIGVDPEEAVDTTDYFETIPLSPNDNLLGWMYNYINLLIGYTTAVSNTMTYGKELKGIILGSLDYYTLPSIADAMKLEADRSLSLYNEAVNYLNLAAADGTADFALTSNISTVKVTIAAAESYMSTVRGEVNTDIIAPLSIINENTDFATFNFAITDGVALTITDQESDLYPFVFSYSMHAKYVSSMYGIPPAYPQDNVVVANNIVDLYSASIRNLVSESLTMIGKLYSSTTTMDITLAALRANETYYNSLLAQQAYFITLPKSLITDSDYLNVIAKVEDLISVFSFGNIMNTVEAIYDPENYDTVALVQAELDAYFDTIGNASSIQVSSLVTAQQELYDVSLDDRITEVFLGGDYEDSGDFYYADIAYAVGYAKLVDIKSIQIDDEYYTLTSSVGLSESGCVKYTFTRHVLPTYDVEVEMFVYPGTLDQPYCPTVNKYHNFNTSSYSGMFTKMEEGEMGVFVFKGYEPMKATVKEVVKIGSMDLNSINLNDPSLDQKSYEAILMKEVKNLTNASSIDDGPITTEDLKYYLSSTLVDDTQTNNYPGLAIIEFKNFPLGSSATLPKIKINVVSEDLVL